MSRQSYLILIAGVLALTVLSSCGRQPAGVIETVKGIPISGGRDTLYIERSRYWDRDQETARVDSNPQTITFQPAPGEAAYITLRNMGGVPLKRDTIRKDQHFPAELFFRTGTLDTNLHLHIEFPDWHRASTDVIVYIRNRDSIYREFLFYGK